MGAGFSMKARGDASAEIYIYEDVGEGWFGGVSAKQFATDLKALGPVERIDVRLNSYGGDVFDGLAIYRQLVDHKATVISHIDGVAASIASVIAMAGNEIHIAEAGFVMIHDAWGVAMGGAAEMRQMADLLETTSGSITDVYAGRTSANRDDIRKMMEAETWMTSAEAIEYGFADEVAQNLKVAARVDPSKHKFRNLPAAMTGRPDFDAAKSRLAVMRNQLEANKRKELQAV